MSLMWSIDGIDLTTRRRSGGATAEKGFTFQRCYALVRMTWLATGERGLMEVRYEGSQDVDLAFGDGAELLVQAKDFVPGTLSSGDMKEVLAGFARELITAKARNRMTDDRPRFRLVCSSTPIENKAYQLLRRTCVDDHVVAIAKEIAEKDRAGLSDAEVLACAKEAWARTTFEFLSPEESKADLKAQATWNLTKFGVPAEKVAVTRDVNEAPEAATRTMYPNGGLSASTPG